MKRALVIGTAGDEQFFLRAGFKKRFRDDVSVIFPNERDAEALRCDRRAVKDEVNILRQPFHGRQIIAVGLLELDPFRKVLQVAPDHVVAADYLNGFRRRRSRQDD